MSAASRRALRGRVATPLLGAALALLLSCGGDPVEDVTSGDAPPQDARSQEVEEADQDQESDGDEASSQGSADPGPQDDGPVTLRQPPSDGEAPAPTGQAPPVGDEEGTGTGQADPSGSAPETSNDPSVAPDGALDGRVIAIDPGHNGGNFDAPEEINRQVDAGGFMKACNTTGTATQDGYRESTFNLEVAELLRARLEEAGVEVHLTRTDDDGVGPCIDLRGTIGQRVGADLTISIHADGAGANARGFHIIHPAAWSGSDPALLDASFELAATLRDVLVTQGKSPANYVGTEGLVARNDLATLNLSEVPVVLLEAGNMRNTADAAELRDPAWQADLVEALVVGIERFLDER